MAPLVLSEDTAAKVLRQVEFYFSDSNLPQDKFLLSSLRESEDGLVSLPIICSFSRMRSHLDIKEHGLDAITPEVTQAVAEVLRKSTVLRLSEDGRNVGRIDNLEKPELVQAEVDARTVAAGPLPYDTTLDLVERVFSPLGKVNSVRLPRNPIGKVFCGSALIEFTSKEEAEKVLQTKLRDEELGVDLELESKYAFDERMKKLQELKLEKDRKAAEIDYPFPEGLIVKFSLTRIGDADAEGEAAHSTDGQQEPSPMEDVHAAVTAKYKPQVLAPECTAEAVPSEKEEEGVAPSAGADATSAEVQEAKIPPVDATTAGDAADKEDDAALKREDIKALMEPYGTVRFVDFTMGATEGYIRFGDAEEAQKARTAAVIAEEGGFVLKGHLMTLEAVDGDAEKAYWRKLRQGQERRRSSIGRGDNGRQWNRGGYAGHSGRRGGRGGGRGRGRGGNQTWDDRQDNGSEGKKGTYKRFRDDDDDAPNGNEGGKKASVDVAFE